MRGLDGLAMRLCLGLGTVVVGVGVSIRYPLDGVASHDVRNSYPSSFLCQFPPWLDIKILIGWAVIGGREEVN